MKTFEPLTTSRIASTSPTKKDIWLTDNDGKRGFGRLLLRISPNGARHFYFRISASGERSMTPLGPYSKDAKPNHLTLNQARVAAQEVFRTFKAKGPQEPVVHRTVGHGNRKVSDIKEPGPIQAEILPANDIQCPPAGNQSTLEQLCKKYAESLQARGKYSASQVPSVLKRHLNGTPLGQTIAAEVTPKQVTLHLREMINAGIERTTQMLRSIIGSSYSEAMKYELDPSAAADYSMFQISSNPVSAVASLSQFAKARTRTLNILELERFWAILNDYITEDIGSPSHNRILRLNILLGGQRCRQLLRARRNDVNMDELTLRIFETKGRIATEKSHVLPISQHAKEDVIWFLSFSKDLNSDYLFPSSKIAPGHINPHSISARVETISDSMQKRYKMPGFRYSDLRRTTQSQMTALRIREEVINRILSHGLGGVVHKHYNFHNYLPEMREALTTWGDFLQSLKAD